MIKALKDSIILRHEYQEESKGGIIIPEAARKHQLYDGKIKYTVVSVGPECPYRIKEGETVEIVRHEGIKFEYEGVEYFKTKPRWVLGVYI